MADTLPSLSDMASLDAENYFVVMEQYGVLPPANLLRMRAQGYVSRMTQYPMGSTQWKNEVEKLISTESKRGMLGTTRRINQMWSTIEDADGDDSVVFMWLCEDDEASCENCMDRAGDENTLADWEVIGLPGGSTCLGGDYCRCDLVRVEYD